MNSLHIHNTNTFIFEYQKWNGILNIALFYLNIQFKMRSRAVSVTRSKTLRNCSVFDNMFSQNFDSQVKRYPRGQEVFTWTSLVNHIHIILVYYNITLHKYRAVYTLRTVLCILHRICWEFEHWKVHSYNWNNLIYDEQAR